MAASAPTFSHALHTDFQLMVESHRRWFRDLTEKRIRRGSFEGVPDLIQAIEDYLDQSNQNPHVFVWTASTESIMAKIAKCKEALDALH